MDAETVTYSYSDFDRHRDEKTDFFVAAVELSGPAHPLRSLDLSPSNHRKTSKDGKKRGSVEVVIAADMTKYGNRVDEITSGVVQHQCAPKSSMPCSNKPCKAAI